MPTNPTYTGTFKEAFAKARKELGSGKSFTWNNQTYTTDTADGAKVTGTGIIPTPTNPIAKGIAGGLGLIPVGGLANGAGRMTTDRGGLRDPQRTGGNGLVDTINNGGVFKGDMTGSGLTGAKGIDYSALAGYIPDVIKFGIGLNGATEKVPEYKVNPEFTAYKNNLFEMSKQGLTNEELTRAKTDAERGYAYDLNAIKSLSGGNAGVALSNIGRASAGLTGAYSNINAMDAGMRRDNMDRYGGALGTQLGLDRTIFQDKLDQATRTKISGANLAANALSDIQSGIDYNQSYGSGSIYQQYMQQMLKNKQLEEENLQYQQQNPFDPNGINISGVNSQYNLPDSTDPYIKY